MHIQPEKVTFNVLPGAWKLELRSSKFFVKQSQQEFIEFHGHCRNGMVSE